MTVNEVELRYAVNFSIIFTAAIFYLYFFYFLVRRITSSVFSVIGKTLHFLFTFHIRKIRISLKSTKLSFLLVLQLY